MSRPSRPAFRFHGSKFLLADWILKSFPDNECYDEAYGGGASLILAKQRSWLEIINDADGEIVNFFRILRERPDDLVRAIHFTPFARVEFELSLLPSDDPLECARRFYARSAMAISGPTAQWRSGWRRQKVVTRDHTGAKRMTPAAISFMSTDHLYTIAERLRGVQIECDDALAIIQRYDSPTTLHYIDPPYPAATRARWQKTAYRHEMTDDQHQQLADLLYTLKGFVVLSGYQCPLYDTLYSNWPRVTRLARTNGAGMAEESLWLSPRTAAALTHTSLPLFAA